MLIKKSNILGIGILFLLCAILATNLQFYVGKQTIYSENLREKREILHKAIYHNKLPDGIKDWGAIGARGTNIRIGIVYLVEYIHQFTGISIHKLYLLLDSIFLFFCLFLLFFFLRKWVDYHYCLIGVLFIGNVFILTYHFHFFHPWDRISLLTWIGLIYSVREKRDILFILILVISVPIKNDVIMAPALYLFYNYFSANNKFIVILKSFIILFIGIFVYELLKYFYPVYDSSNVGFLNCNAWLMWTSTVTKNFRYIVMHNIAYPPFLMFVVPCILAIKDWKEKDLFCKSSVAFAALLFIIHFSLANFREVRAETMILVVLLPSALLSAKKLVEGKE